jgi:DNA processing protein
MPDGTPGPAESLALWRIAQTEGIGPMGFRRLLARHGSGTAALDALPRLLAKREAPARIPSLEDARREADAMAKLGARFIFWGDPGYPPLLALLADAPAMLAVQGDAALLAQKPSFAIVGARNASAAGRRIAEDSAGVLVISGLARGVDAAAHQGALRAGRTLAVLPGGLDVAYPPENAALQARIGREGAVVAEHALGTAPLARHFPKRNRIVAGLSLGVLVVEAAERSGTLITARLALEAGREVFAIPGSPLDPRSRGANDLIRQGAHLVESAADVLAHLPEAPNDTPLFALAPSPENPIPEDVPAEATPGEYGQLIDLIGMAPISVDDLLRRCHLSPPALQAALADLELEGRVDMLPGHRVALSGRG